MGALPLESVMRLELSPECTLSFTAGKFESFQGSGNLLDSFLLNSCDPPLYSISNLFCVSQPLGFANISEYFSDDSFLFWVPQTRSEVPGPKMSLYQRAGLPSKAFRMHYYPPGSRLQQTLFQPHPVLCFLTSTSFLPINHHAKDWMRRTFLESSLALTCQQRTKYKIYYRLPRHSSQWLWSPDCVLILSIHPILLQLFNHKTKVC